MAKIKGNKKNNKLKGSKHKDKIIGAAGNDVLKGKAGDDKLLGGAGDDILDGGDGNDVMKGGGGNDLFIAGVGADFFIGGKGIDTVSFAANAFGITVELLLQTSTQGGLRDGFSGIENIDGSAFGDTIEGDGADNHFRGFGGKDYLKGGDGNDILDGGEGDDQLYSDKGADKLIGGNGYDSVVYEKETSGAVIDLATGIGGGSAAGDTFSSIERVFATKYADTVKGTGAGEAFFGEGGNDTLYGNGGNDTLFGGAGMDTLYGGSGNDRFFPEGDKVEADHLYGGSGSDWADYSDAGAAVTVLLYANSSDGRAKGDIYQSIESVEGSDYDDFLAPANNGRAYGGWGDDIVIDAGGTEILRGGRGDDLLSDNFISADDGFRDIFVLEVGLGMDTVSGFTQSSDQTGDRFWLPKAQFDDLDFNANGILAAGTQVHNKVNDNAATTGAAQLIFQQNTKILWYDADGTGAAAPVAIAKILGLNSIQTYDFVVVPDM